MDNVAQCSERSLKCLGVIEAPYIENRIVNGGVVMSSDGQTELSRRNKVHTGMSRVLSASSTPLLRLNLEDKGIYRHWSPGSQIFVGGDTLLTVLDSGWEIAGTVLRHEYSCTSKCCTCVYHLHLHRDGECSSMKVVENPWVTRLLHQLQVEIVSEISP